MLEEICISRITLELNSKKGATIGSFGRIEAMKELPLRKIEKIVNFARKISSTYLNVVLSGYAPLQHPELYQILEVLSKSECSLTLHTDGRLLKEDHLKILSKDFRHSAIIFTFLDVFPNNSEEHKIASKALDMINSCNISNISVLFKMIVQENTMNKMGIMAIIAKQKRCNGIIFSTITSDKKAILDKNDLFAILSKVKALQQEYDSGQFVVYCADPLMRILYPLKNFPCSAGINSFYVTPDEEFLPCHFFRIPIMDQPFSVEKYKESPVIRSLLSSNVKGKCKKCPDKDSGCIGGCIARVYHVYGSYKNHTDPACWIK